MGLHGTTDRNVGELNEDKTEAYHRDPQVLRDFFASPAGAAYADFSIGHSVGRGGRRIDGTFAPSGYGVMLSGIPYGDRDFKSSSLTRKAVKACEHNKKTTTLLQPSSCQARYALLVYCESQLLTSASADAQERDSDEADMPALEGVSSSDEDSQSDVGDLSKTPRRSGHGVPNASVQIPTPAPPVPVPRKPPEAGKQAGKPALEPVRKPLGAARINMAGPPAPD